MKYLITFLIVFITFSSNCQEKRHLIGAGFSPEATYRTLPNGGIYNDIESFGFGFTTGIGYSYNIKWFCAIETGLYFSVKSQEMDYSILSFGDQIDPRRGFIYNTDKMDETFSVQNNFIEIPVKFNFYFTKSMFKPFIGVGLSNNFYIGRMTSYKPLSSSSNPFMFMMQGLVSAGLDIDFAKKFTFRIEPQFKHAFLSVDDNGNVYKEYPYSIGCMFGFYYRIN